MLIKTKKELEDDLAEMEAVMVRYREAIIVFGEEVPEEKVEIPEEKKFKGTFLRNYVNARTYTKLKRGD